MRRGLSVIVLMATALVIYLVMSDQPLSVGDSPASAVVHEAGIHAFSDIAHDGSGRPILTSDEVSAPRCDTVEAASSTIGYRVTVVTTIPGNALRHTTVPTLGAPQVLRC